MSRAPKFGGEKIQQGVSFVFFYWTWHPSFIKIRASFIEEPMVNNDEFIKSYGIKVHGKFNLQNSNNLIILHYSKLQFHQCNIFSPYRILNTKKNLQTKRSVLRSKHPSKSLKRSQHLRLILALAGLSAGPKLSQLHPLKLRLLQTSGSPTLFDQHQRSRPQNV